MFVSPLLITSKLYEIFAYSSALDSDEHLSRVGETE